MQPHEMKLLSKGQLVKLINMQDKTIKDLKSKLHGTRISRGRWRAEAIHLNLINKEVA